VGLRLQSQAHGADNARDHWGKPALAAGRV